MKTTTSRLLLSSILGLVVGIGSLSTSQTAQAQNYTVTDLGSLGGGDSWAWGITTTRPLTGNHYIVGASKNAAANGRAFYYTTTMSSLNTLGAASGAVAYGVIPRGGGYDAIGSGVTGAAATHGAAWLGLGAASDLGTLTGGANSVMFGVNLNGWRVGRSEVTGGDTHVWIRTQAGVNTDCGTLGGNYGSAQNMNDLGSGSSPGDFVGGARDGTGQLKPFAYFTVNPSCTLTQLPTLGGSEGQARDINNIRHIAGFSNITGNTATHATYWPTPSTPFDLGTLGGTNSVAYAINVANQIVGTADNAAAQPRAFIWNRAGGMVDLNTKLPPGSGWVLEYAMAISDDGYIVGRGTRLGVASAFVLSP